jgi:hypothetical protein
MQPLTSTENTCFLNGKWCHQNKVHWHTQGGGGAAGVQPLTLVKAKFKETNFVDALSKVLRDLRCILIQPLKLADD